MEIYKNLACLKVGEQYVLHAAYEDETSNEVVQNRLYQKARRLIRLETQGKYDVVFENGEKFCFAVITKLAVMEISELDEL